VSLNCRDLLRAFDFRAEPIIAEHTAPSLTRGLSGLFHVPIHTVLIDKKISSRDCVGQTRRKDVCVSVL